jgi:hypothetical protein
MKRKSKLSVNNSTNINNNLSRTLLIEYKKKKTTTVVMNAEIITIQRLQEILLYAKD